MVSSLVSKKQQLSLALAKFSESLKHSSTNSELSDMFKITESPENNSVLDNNMKI